MSRKQNWYIGRYVRAVSGFLPCSGKVKKPLLDALRAQAEEYIEGGGDAAALEQRFGTPQQVAAAWVDEMRWTHPNCWRSCTSTAASSWWWHWCWLQCW